MTYAARMASGATLAALLLSLGCQFSDSRKDDDDDEAGGASGKVGFGGAGGSGGSGGSSAGASGSAGTDGSGGDSGSGGSGGDAGASGAAGAGGSGSCDASTFTGVHFWDPECIYPEPGHMVCHEVRFEADGTYHRQMIHMMSGSQSLFCEYGTWQMLDCATLELVPCSGDPYSQDFTQSGSELELQGVSYEAQADGFFLCGANECD